MTYYNPDLGSASDWLKPIRRTAKILVATRHQYGISALVTQTSFCEGSSGDLAKRRLFSQAMLRTNNYLVLANVKLLHFKKQFILSLFKE